jgi:hypothetical protein
MQAPALTAHHVDTGSVLDSLPALPEEVMP